MTKIIMVGSIFGEWTVLEETINRTKGRNTLWLCRCSCGLEKEVSSSSLRQGRSTSCGHNRMKNMVESRQQTKESIVGKQFGRLVVLELSDKIDDFGHKLLKCQCTCGTVIYVTKARLESGRTASCGCLKSRGEEMVSEILTEMQLSFAKEVRFPNCKDKKPLPFDFGIYWNKKLKGLIEYHGNVHFGVGHGGYYTETSFQEMQASDKIKVQYCLDNKIPLLVIPHTVKDIKTFLITSDFWKQITKSFND